MEHADTAIPARVTLSSGPNGDEISIDVSVETEWSGGPPFLQVELASHDAISSMWCASVGCARATGSQTWSGQVEMGLEHPQLLEVTGVRAESEAIRVEVGTDDQLHLEPPTPGVWVTGPDARAELSNRLAEREAIFGRPLVAPDASTGADSFAAVMVADNVHLTAPHRVPGLTILPLQNASVGIDIAVVLNDVLPELGYPAQVDLQRWLEMMQRHNPAAIVQAPAIQARSAEEARRHVSQLTHQLLDITALRRGARPRLLGGVLLSRDVPGQHLSITPWVESRGYTGNLLGGFISGEDPHHLIKIWDGTRKDPRTQLWLSMYGDALADARPDYRFFRSFNLLEAIATEAIPRNQVILNDAGTPELMANGKPYTTLQARGNVFELLRHVASVGQMTQSSFATPTQLSIPHEANTITSVPGDLWDEMDVWVKVRNAVAHRGTWRLPVGEQSDAARQKLEARIEGFSGTGGGVAMGFATVVGTISRAVETTLYQAIAGRL